MTASTCLSPDDTNPRSRACPSCRATTLDSIYTVRDIPTNSSVLLDTRDAALQIPRRDLELAFCNDCGLAFNRLFDDEAISYDQSREESQHFSDKFNRFATGLAREIAEQCHTHGKRVLEIGCGKGDFLLALAAVGQCTGIGIDPAFRPERIVGRESSRVQFIADWFGPQYYDLPADIVLCRHTLEHIPDVAQFVTSVSKLIQKRPGRLAIFETPDARRIFAEGAFWDVYYEHCNYFSLGSHARLFRQCGFEITDLKLVYDGQYIFQKAAAAVSQPTTSLPQENDLADISRVAHRFPSQVEAAQAHWRGVIQDAVRDGRKAVLWGGGSKAVAFLATLDLRDEIDCVVDVNPHKQGRFTPGSGHAIVSPDDLTSRSPSLIIVMNPIYVGEIRSQLKRLGLAAQVLAV